MRSPIYRALFVGVLFTAGCVGAQRRREVGTEAQTHEEIEACLKAFKPPSWAGTYRDVAGHHGSDRVIALCTAGFTHKFTLPGANMRWNGVYGTVEQIAPDRFLLTEAIADEIRILRLIPWDKRVFAVYEDEMLDFINTANHGWGFHPYREDADRRRDHAQPSGLPEIPAQWRDFLFKAPLYADISSVSSIVKDRGSRMIQVTVSAGSRQGVLRGHELLLRCADSEENIRIKHVSDDSSIGDIVQYDSMTPFDSQCLPIAGQKVSSRDRDLELRALRRPLRTEKK